MDLKLWFNIMLLILLSYMCFAFTFVLCCQEFPDGSEISVEKYNQFLAEMTTRNSDLQESIAGIKGTLGARRKRA